MSILFIESMNLDKKVDFYDANWQSKAAQAIQCGEDVGGSRDSSPDFENFSENELYMSLQKESRDGLFEEMAENNYSLGINPKTGEWGLKQPKSLWLLFLYAI